MSVRNYLNRPHPRSDNQWIVLFAVSIFIALFMLFFQPFGLSYFKHEQKTLILMGYGFVTFIVLFFNFFILPLLFRSAFADKNWTVFRHIFWLTWIIFTIGIGNYVYSDWIFSFSHLSWKTFLIFQFFTLVIGLFPVVIITISEQNRLLAKHLKSANEFNEQLKKLPQVKNIHADQIVSLVSENEKDKLVTTLADLLYIESVGNYAEVCHLKDGNVKKEILRTSLKRLEQALEKYNDLQRCHRAFIVNINKVQHARGNSQGYRLQMKDIEQEIPVSRNYTKTLRERLN